MSHFAGEGWHNGFVPQQTGLYQLGFQLTGGGDGLDAVIGLSNGPAHSFTDLGPIVRLNPNGRVDVRNGDTYMADADFPYESGLPINVTMNIDLPNHVYDVDAYRNYQFSNAIPLARGYRFRTEQSAVPRLDNLARIVDSPAGAFGLCGLIADSWEHCLVTSAGGAWSSRTFPVQSGHFRVSFQAYSSDSSVDSVIGLSNGAPTAFRSLAAILRFNEHGQLDARDGDVYRSDMPISYVAWRSFRVLMDVDMVNHTYSIELGAPLNDETPDTLARNYRFRTEQAAVGSLNQLSEFVDSSFGNVYSCSLTIDY